MAVPKKIASQIQSGMKQLLPVIEQQASRDVSEADTVTLIKDLLSEAFGYDKYSELTGEHAIRGTYCDIVIQLSGKPTTIVEVKAIGIKLDDKHVKQSIDYAANQGVDWVILTNAVHWRLYKVVFAKPIDKHLVCDIDLTSLNLKSAEAIECLYLLTKHAYQKGVPAEALDRKLALSRHMIAALLLHNDSLLNAVRRELKRISEVNVDIEEIRTLLREDVIKRDALEGAAAEAAAKLVNKREDRKLRSQQKKANAKSSGNGSSDAKA